MKNKRRIKIVLSKIVEIESNTQCSVLHNIGNLAIFLIQKDPWLSVPASQSGLAFQYLMKEFTKSTLK